MSVQTNTLPDNPQIEVIKSGKTGLFTNYIYKAIPLAFDESMSYYETLCGLLNYLKNVILPTVNNNADAVSELQTLYEELRTYVDDYFKNLDVQEEINNKLDDMVEQGTLQEIIASYLNSKALFGYDNVDDMKNATNLINGSYAQTLGYYSKNDGGSALYKIRTITNDDVVNNKTIIALTNNTLIAELIVKNSVNVKQLGAYGDDSHNDTDVLQFAINNFKNVNIPSGTYIINDSLKLTTGVTINGENPTNTIIKTNTDISIFENISNSNYVTIKNLKLLCTTTSTKNAINIIGTTSTPFTGATYSNFSEITIDGFYNGIFVNHIWNTIFNKIRILNCTNRGIFLGGGCNNVLIDMPMLEHLTQGIRITTSDGDSVQNTNITINNPDIEYCTTAIYLYNDENITINDIYSEHNTLVVYAFGTKGLKIDGYYSAFDTKLAEIISSKTEISNGFTRVNSNDDMGIISTQEFINLKNLSSSNNGSGKIFNIVADINKYIPTIYSNLNYDVEGESFRLRYSSDKYNGTFNADENNGLQYSCYKPCLKITSNDLVASSGDQIQLKRNGNVIATLSINSGTSLNKNDILEFTASNTNAKNFIYQNGDEYEITHTNTTGVDVNFKMIFRNIKTGQFISNI